VGVKANSIFVFSSAPARAGVILADLPLMIGKGLGSCYKFIAVLPVLLTRINSYKIFANQLFELGFIVEEVTLPYQLTNIKKFLSFGRRGRRLSLEPSDVVMSNIVTTKALAPTRKYIIRTTLRSDTLFLSHDQLLCP